jgi:Transglycosylase SLT domain
LFALNDRHFPLTTEQVTEALGKLRIHGWSFREAIYQLPCRCFCPASLLLRGLSMDGRSSTKKLRSIGMAVALLMAPVAMAQNKQQDNQLRRIVALSEAKHLRSRHNLLKILREHPQFWPELQAIAERLKTQPAWLLNVMAAESLFDPSARNSLPGQSASGLLQFVNETARRLGTTTAAIREMDPVKQLSLVEKYFAQFRGRLNSMANVYMAVLRGFIVDGKDEAVVSPLDNSHKEKRIFALNRWLDLNSDSKITKGELYLAATLIGRFQPQEYRSQHFASSTSIDLQPLNQSRSIFIRSTRPIE